MQAPNLVTQCKVKHGSRIENVVILVSVLVGSIILVNNIVSNTKGPHGKILPEIFIIKIL